MLRGIVITLIEKAFSWVPREVTGLEGGATSVMRVITEELPEDLS